MRRKSFYLFVIAALFLLSSATIGLAGAQGGGEVRAVDLLGAWVDGGAPNGDFTFTGADGNAYTANFEADVLPLFTTPGAWFSGSQACTECHYDNSEDSYHEMDLSSYEGILAGADVISKAPGEEIVTPGDWENSKLRARMRNNRMPPGWEFDLTEENRDSANLDMIGAWVDAGAPNDADFTDNILPLFTTPDVWFPGSQACTECHYDNSEDSYHEMDLSSYEGILAGADVISKAPGEEILTPGDWEESKLRARMRNNRMPPGWEFDITEENRDGPTLVVGQPATGDEAPAEEAPAALPESGGDKSGLVWWLAAAGLVTLLAGLAIRRREQHG